MMRNQDHCVAGSNHLGRRGKAEDGESRLPCRREQSLGAPRRGKVEDGESRPPGRQGQRIESGGRDKADDLAPLLGAAEDEEIRPTPSNRIKVFLWIS